MFVYKLKFQEHKASFINLFKTTRQQDVLKHFTLNFLTIAFSVFLLNLNVNVIQMPF